MCCELNQANHKTIFRGKDITDYYKSGKMSHDIRNADFWNIYIGDYLYENIDTGSGSIEVKFMVGDIDYFYGLSQYEDLYHHVLLFPVADLGKERMNTSDTTASGYVGSYMNKTVLPKYREAVKTSFGESHVLSFTRRYVSTVTTTGASMNGGGATGYSSAVTVTTDVAQLFTGGMIGTSYPGPSSRLDTYSAYDVIHLFRVKSCAEIFKDSQVNVIWLADISSNTFFRIYSVPEDIFSANTASMQQNVVFYFLYS